MGRPRRPRRSNGWLLLALVLLFPMGASASIACCAGALDPHPISNGEPAHCGQSGSCCDRAAEDAVARHCCQGGDAFERPPAGAPPIVDAPPAVFGAATRAAAALFAIPSTLRDPVPRFEPLYRLHSSLLI